MNKYIVLTSLEVSNANAQPVWWIVSAPAITAYVGFAHALALRLNAKRHHGVAIVHHDIQLLGEQPQNKQSKVNLFHPHQFRASGLIDGNDYVKGSKNLSSQPTARCHLNISLVIAIPDDAELNQSKIQKFLRGARIAGGTIVNSNKVLIVRTLTEAIDAVEKSGYSIIERQDLMVKQEEDEDMIDVLLRHTRRYIKKIPEQVAIEESSSENTIEAGEAESAGWIVPTCLGYAGISSLQERNKAREGLQHLYVEPLVGLIQYKSLRETGLHFWRYVNSKPNVFITSTKEI